MVLVWLLSIISQTIFIVSERFYLRVVFKPSEWVAHAIVLSGGTSFARDPTPIGPRIKIASPVPTTVYGDMTHRHDCAAVGKQEQERRAVRTQELALERLSREHQQKQKQKQQEREQQLQLQRGGPGFGSTSAYPSAHGGAAGAGLAAMARTGARAGIGRAAPGAASYDGGAGCSWVGSEGYLQVGGEHARARAQAGGVREVVDPGYTTEYCGDNCFLWMVVFSETHAFPDRASRSTWRLAYLPCEIFRCFFFVRAVSCVMSNNLRT